MWKLCDCTWSNAGRSLFFSPSSRAGRSRAKLLQKTMDVSRHLTIHSLKEIPMAATPKDMASTIRVPYVADTVPEMLRSKLIIGLLVNYQSRQSWIALDLIMLTSLVFESHWQQLELVSALLQKGGKTLFWWRAQIVSIRVVHKLWWIRSGCARTNLQQSSYKYAFTYTCTHTHMHCGGRNESRCFHSMSTLLCSVSLVHKF